MCEVKDMNAYIKSVSLKLVVDNLHRNIATTQMSRRCHVTDYVDDNSDVHDDFLLSYACVVISKV